MTEAYKVLKQLFYGGQQNPKKINSQDCYANRTNCYQQYISGLLVHPDKGCLLIKHRFCMQGYIKPIVPKHYQVERQISILLKGGYWQQKEVIFHKII